jgi:hypothetical protein
MHLPPKWQRPRCQQTRKNRDGKKRKEVEREKEKWEEMAKTETRKNEQKCLSWFLPT